MLPIMLLQWSLRFKTSPLNNPLYFKTGYQWHHSYIFNIFKTICLKNIENAKYGLGGASILRPPSI